MNVKMIGFFALLACNNPGRAGATGDGGDMGPNGSDAGPAVDAQADGGTVISDASNSDATTSSVPTHDVYYFSCPDMASMSGLHGDYFLYNYIQVAGDFAIGGQAESGEAMYDDWIYDCSNTSLYTCSGFPNFSTGTVEQDLRTEYRFVGEGGTSLIAICDGDNHPSTFGNQVAIWGDVTNGSSSYPASAELVTCDQTATLGGPGADNNTVKVWYTLKSIPTGEYAIVSQSFLVPGSPDIYTGYVYNVMNTNCDPTTGGFSCSNMPTGTQSTDLLGNVEYGGQLLIACGESVYDPSTSSTSMAGSNTAVLVTWSP